MKMVMMNISLFDGCVTCVHPSVLVASLLSLLSLLLLSFVACYALVQSKQGQPTSETYYTYWTLGSCVPAYSLKSNI